MSTRRRHKEFALRVAAAAGEDPYGLDHGVPNYSDRNFEQFAARRQGHAESQKGRMPQELVIGGIGSPLSYDRDSLFTGVAHANGQGFGDMSLADAEFTARLLAWFDGYGRHNLPWTLNPTPYWVWISEVML